VGQVYSWHIDMGQVYLQMVQFSFVTIIELLLYTLFSLHTLLSEGQSGVTLATANKAVRNIVNKRTAVPPYPLI
jgi:hypothetical protein